MPRPCTTGILVSLAFFFAGISLYAQENTDSLKAVLRENGPDSSRVKTLNRLSWDLRSVDPKAAMDYAKEANALAEKLHFDRGLGDSYSNMGVLHYRRGEYVEAAKAHLQALRIRENTGDREGMALSYINLGNVYSDQNNNTLALDEYLHAAALLRETGDTKRLPIIYLNIGAIFLAEGKYDEGLSYCEKAREGAHTNAAEDVEAEALNNIGVVFQAKEKYAEAMEAYQQSYQLSEKNGDKTEMVDNMTNIGTIYRLQKQFPAALEWHFKTETLARSITYLEGLRVLYQEISNDYKAMGKFENALDYQIRFKALSDSLFNDENTSRLNEMTLRWDNDRREKDLVRQQQELFQNQLKEKEATQKTWLWGGGLLALFLFIAYVIYAQGKIRRAELLLEAQRYEMQAKRKS